MSFVPIETIRSEHLRKIPKKDNLNYSDKFLTIKQIYQLVSPDVITRLTLLNHLGNPVYKIIAKSDQERLFHAITGTELFDITKKQVSKIALSNYQGEGRILNIQLLTEKIIEYRGKLPVWKVDFSGSESLSMYISPKNGRVKGLRSTVWRVYDFLWMLHIMDYEDRENFNHWLIILAAVFGVAMSITGIYLIFYSFRKKDFAFFALLRSKFRK